MIIAIVNYAPPQVDPHGGGIRWWHKAGSRWPATILNRANDGLAYFPWPFLLGYLEAMLDDDGHRVHMFDGCLEKWTTDDLLAAVSRVTPDFIVFESSEQTERLDRLVVAQLGGIAPVLLIGPNVAEDRLDLLTWEGCHAAVPGEYLSSVVRYFREPGVGMAERHEVVGRERMDALPFARRDPRTFPRYSARFKTTPSGVQGQFVSMWGCQYRCKFCIWIHSYWPNTSQLKKAFSMERLEAEIDDMLGRTDGVTSLYDDADNHHYRSEEAYRYAEIMGRKRLPWAILTRADTFMKNGDIDRDIWRSYRDNGCYAVKIGVEGVQEVVESTNKRLSEQVVREFIPFVQDLGISVYCSFMLAVPGATGADARTLQMVEQLADYRPDLFEYFISRCDVTEVTPFAKEYPRLTTAHDGQQGFELMLQQADAPASFRKVWPNNSSHAAADHEASDGHHEH